MVDAAFGQRRKTLRAALSGWAGSAPEAERLLRAAGIDPAARGEALGVAEFARLAAVRAARAAYALTIVTGVTARVPAKLNLQLAVGPPRADGYHDLVTVFHAVALFDEVTVEPAERDTVTVTGEGASTVPHDGDNLALRAVAALRKHVRGGNRTAGVRVSIAKRIPVAAGLAGGSADAAAALVAANELWTAGLTPQRLAEIAATIGSDVAFALLGGTAVGRGRGERLTPALAPATQYHWVLAFAEGQLSTPKVYAALDRLRSRGSGGPGGSGGRGGLGGTTSPQDRGDPGGSPPRG